MTILLPFSLNPHDHKCTCIADKRYDGCMRDDSRSNEELLKYFNEVSKGNTNYADGVIGLWFLIKPSQIEMLVDYLNSNDKIYALVMNLHELTPALAQALTKCKHLKKAVFRIKPRPKVLKILHQKKGLELIFRGEIPRDAEYLEQTNKL